MIFSGLVVKSRLRKALDLLNCGMYPQAATELEGILHTLRDPGQEDKRKPILFYLAECYMAMGDEKFDQREFQSALENFDSAEALGVNFPDIYFWIGQACSGLGDFRRAEEALKKAITLNPRYVKARLSLADLYGQQEKFEPAIQEYQLLYEQGTLCDGDLFQSGMRTADKGELKKGCALMKDSFQDKPDPVKAIYLKGMKCYKEKDYSGAIRQLEKVLNEHPDYPDIHNFLGVACCGDNSYDKAKEAFLKAIELNNQYVEARLNLAFLYERLKEKEKAEHELREVLSIDPGNVIALEGLENLAHERADG